MRRTPGRPREMNSNSSSIWPSLAKFLRPCPSLSLLVTPMLHFTGRSSPIWRVAPGSFLLPRLQSSALRKRRKAAAGRDVAAPPYNSDPLSPVGHRRSTRIAVPTLFLARQSAMDAHIDAGSILATLAIQHARLALTIDSGHRGRRGQACVISPAPQ